MSKVENVLFKKTISRIQEVLVVMFDRGEFRGESLRSKKKREEIFNLDLSEVKNRLISPIKYAGLGWSRKKADEIELMYKAFLFVCWKYRKDHNVPSIDLDYFWHYHILCTKKYMKDSQKIFGKYLHHNPD